MSKVTITTGPDAGKTMYVSGIRDGVVMPFIARAAYVFDNVKAGDKIQVDNRDWIAYMFYHRYGLEALTKKLGLQTREHALMFPEHRALMGKDGKPLYPQRDIPTGWYPGLNGKFKGKMILITGVSDEPIWPTQMTPYERMIRQNLGAAVDDQFRFWWLDHVPHCSGPLEGPRSTREANAMGLTAQALRDVLRWVEEGVAPAPSMAYQYAEDNQLVLPSNANERKGIQPVVNLQANGGARADVRVGTAVQFTANAEVPPGGGSIVRVDWDFDGEGSWPEDLQVPGDSTSFSGTMTHAYTKPGTYFAAIRVGSHMGGTADPSSLIYNLGRVRVVVR